MDHDTEEISWSGVSSERLEVLGYIGDELIFKFSFRVDAHQPDGVWEGRFQGRFLSIGSLFPPKSRAFESLSDGIETVSQYLRAYQNMYQRIKAAEDRAKEELNNLDLKGSAH